MDIFHSTIAARLVFVLGIVNLVTGSLLFFSCRCVPKRWMTHRRFKQFFSFHCYLWYIFWPSVVVHAIFAISYFGVPAFTL